MANLVIVLGVISIGLGIASWIGWYPAVRRTGLFRGGTHADLAIMGVGMITLGVAGIFHVLAAALVGLAIAVAGFVLGLISPPWLVPSWYKERYPDTPPSK